MFCGIASLHEGVDSNLWLPLQCKLCLNINGLYYGKRDCKYNLCDHMNHLVQVLDTLWILRDSLHICNQKHGMFYILQLQGGQPIVICIFWLEKLWRYSTSELFPSSGSRMHVNHFPDEFLWANAFFGGQSMTLSCALLSSNFYNMKSRGN